MDRFGLIGFSHRRGSAEELARFSRRPDDLERLRRILAVDELVHLATCNRVELLYASRDRIPADRVLKAYAAWLAPNDPAGQEVVTSAFYALNGDAAVKHLNNMVCGLDSLVFGDEQIVGQFRAALVEAREAGTCGPTLGLIGDEALIVSKKIRGQVDFGKRPTSVAEVAVQVLRQRLGGRDRSRVVLVGSGQMIRAIAARLKNRKGIDLHFVNRTLLHAEALAAFHGGSAESLAGFQEQAGEFDALVAATAAPHAVILAEHLAHLPPRPSPRLILDLGMPADVEPAIAEQLGWERNDVIELGRRAAAGRREAELMARAVRPHLRDALQRLRNKFLDRDLSPACQRMRGQVEERSHAELSRWLRGPLRHLGEDDREAVVRLVDRLAQQVSQVPILAMRQLARELPVSAEIHDFFCSWEPSGRVRRGG